MDVWFSAQPRARSRNCRQRISKICSITLSACSIRSTACWNSAKIEAGKMEVHVQPVNVDEVIQGAISTIEPILNGGGVRIIREIAPDIPDMSTDREKLRQILLNLLDNAVKFTERGEIKIAASQQNGSLKLVVSDTGIGIEKEELNQIFEEFHRGDSSEHQEISRHGSGAGHCQEVRESFGRGGQC